MLQDRDEKQHPVEGQKLSSYQAQIGSLNTQLQRP